MQFLLSNGTNILNLNCSRGNFLPNLFLDPFFLQLLGFLTFENFEELASREYKDILKASSSKVGPLVSGNRKYTMVASQRSQHTYVR